MHTDHILYILYVYAHSSNRLSEYAPDYLVSLALGSAKPRAEDG